MITHEIASIRKGSLPGLRIFDLRIVRNDPHANVQAGAAPFRCVGQLQIEVDDVQAAALFGDHFNIGTQYEVRHLTLLQLRHDTDASERAS